MGLDEFLEIEVDLIVGLVIRVHASALGVNGATDFFTLQFGAVLQNAGFLFAAGAEWVELAAGTRRNAGGRSYARRRGHARGARGNAARRSGSLFVIFRNLAVEAFLTLASEGENQHAVFGINVLVGEVDAVAIEGPVALAPTGAIKRVEIVSPVESEVAAAFALARSVLINLDPVNELEQRKLGFVECANPFSAFRRPQVEAETLGSLQVRNLTAFGLTDFFTVYSPTNVVWGPFEAVGMECLVGSRAHGVVLFASFLGTSLTGNDVRLETARVFTQNFDIDFNPRASVGDFRTVLVKEHGTDGAGCCSHLHTGFEFAVLDFL